jgi:hypothetical protein
MTITGSNTTNFGFQKLGSNDSAGYSTINEVVDGIDTILNASDRLIKAAQTPTVAYVITGDGTDWVRGLVVTASITDLNVTTGKLADLAVTTGKIAANAVTADKIESSVALPGQPTVGTATGAYPVTGNDSRIASVKYVNDAAASLTAGTSFVVGGDLSGTTGAATIVSGAVTSAKIADDTIVNADVNSAAAIAYSKLNLASSVTSADIVDGTIVAGDISSTYPGHQVLTTTDKNALVGVTTGTMVFDSDLASLQVYNGSAWVQRNVFVGNTTAIKSIRTGSTAATTDSSGVVAISTGLSTVDFFSVTHGTHGTVGNLNLGRNQVSSGGTIYVKCFIAQTAAAYQNSGLTIDWMAVGNP